MVCKVCGSGENVYRGRCGICWDIKAMKKSGLPYGQHVAQFGNAVTQYRSADGMKVCVVCGKAFRPGRKSQVCCSKECSAERKRLKL